MASSLLSDEDMGIKPALLSDEDVGLGKQPDKAQSGVGAQSKPTGWLSNSPDDGAITSALKGGATAVIEGLSDVPGAIGNLRDMERYVVDRINSYAYGRTMDETKARREHYGRAPADIFPSGDDIARPVLDVTGRYEPEDSAGRIGMAATRALTGGAGLGVANSVMRGAKSAPEILGALKEAAPLIPSNAAAGAAGQAATDATGEPLYGMGAGMLAGPAAHGATKLGGYAASKVGPPLLSRFSEDYAKTQAGKRLLDIAEDPEAFRKAADNAAEQREGLPNSPKTSGQLTGDKGILQAERTFTDADKEFELRMREVGEGQNAARLDALGKIPKEGSSAYSVVDAVEARLNGITEKYDGLVANLEKKAREEAAKLGDRADPEYIGSELRGAIEAARKSEKKEINALYDAVDPNEDLRLVVKGVSDAAADMLKKKDPLAEFTEKTDELLAVAKGLPEVIPFKSLRAFDRRLSDATSTERRVNGESESLKHLSRLKGAVKDAINKAVENQAAWEEAAGIPVGERLERRIGSFDRGDTSPGDAPTDIGARVRQAGVYDGRGEVAPRAESGAPRPEDGRPGDVGRLPGLAEGPGDTGKVFYPGGNVDVRYEVVDLGSIKPSHGTDFTPNPAFPKELQPRNRASKPAQDQVLSMAEKLTPERLGRSAEANTGAPVVGPDGVVESGNGRTIAAMINYNKGDPAGYRAWLENQGYDVSGMERPILVARRTTELSPEQRVFMTESANSPTGLRLGTVEQSGLDAKAMTPDVVARLADGPLTGEANRDFVTSFLSKLTANDRGDLVDPKTRALTQKGVNRVQAAIMQSAYGDADIVTRGFESTENNIKNITGAMSDAAGSWAKLRAAVNEGLITPDHDVTTDLLGVVKDVMRARDQGRPVAEVLNQLDMLGGKAGADVRSLLLNGDKVASRPQIAARLKKYADESVKNVSGDALFPSEVTPAKIMSTATGAAFEEAAAAPQTQTMGDKIPIDADKTPNMKRGQAEALDASNKRYGQYARTYKQGDVGSILRTRGYANDYQVIDSAVANRAVRTGDTGYQVAKQFMDAAKGSDAAVNAIREQLLNKVRDAMSDGVLNPQKLDVIRSKYAGAIRALEEKSPGFGGMISKPASAANALMDMAVQRKTALDAFRREQAAKFAGVKSATDIENQIGRLVAGRGASVDKLKEFMSGMTPEAREGVQRAAIDWMFRNETNKGDVLSSAKIDSLFKNNLEHLKVVFSEEQIGALRAIQRDLQMSDRTADIVRSIGGGSRTARDGNIRESIMAAISPLMQEGYKFAFITSLIHSFQAGGLKAAVPYGVGKLVKDIGADLRARGYSRVNDLVKDALFDQELLRDLLKRVPPSKSNPAASMEKGIRGALNRHLLRTLYASSPTYGYGEDKNSRRARASGGRVRAAMTPDQIIAGIERCRKEEQQRTKVILDQPDESVVKALTAAAQTL